MPPQEITSIQPNQLLKTSESYRSDIVQDILTTDSATFKKYARHIKTFKPQELLKIHQSHQNTNEAQLVPKILATAGISMDKLVRSVHTDNAHDHRQYAVGTESDKVQQSIKAMDDSRVANMPAVINRLEFLIRQICKLSSAESPVALIQLLNLAANNWTRLLASSQTTKRDWKTRCEIVEPLLQLDLTLKRRMYRLPTSIVSLASTSQGYLVEAREYVKYWLGAFQRRFGQEIISKSPATDVLMRMTAKTVFVARDRAIEEAHYFVSSFVECLHHAQALNIHNSKIASAIAIATELDANFTSAGGRPAPFQNIDIRNQTKECTAILANLKTLRSAAAEVDKAFTRLAWILHHERRTSSEDVDWPGKLENAKAGLAKVDFWLNSRLRRYSKFPDVLQIETGLYEPA